MKNKQRNALLRLIFDSKIQLLGMIIFIGLLLISGVINTISANIWGSVVDEGMQGQFEKIIPLGLFMVALMGADFVRLALQSVVTAYTFERIFLNIRLRAFEILNRVQMNVLEKKVGSGDFIGRVNADTEALCDIFTGDVTWLLTVLFQAVPALISCFFLSWQLSLAYFTILPISIWLINKISKPIQKQRKAAANHDGKSISIATDTLNGLMIVKSFCSEKKMDERFSSSVDEALSQTIKSEQASAKMVMVRHLSSTILLLILFVAGIFLVNLELNTVGNILAFFVLSKSVQAAMELMDRMLNAYRQAVALSQRIYEIFDLPVEPSGEQYEAKNEGDIIEINDLKFGYEGKDWLFQNLVLRLKQGEKIALIGESGSGKSTIIKLICKFYTYTQGKFYFFHHPIKQWDPTALRKELALVTQDALLFDDSIFQNVRYGRPDVTEEEVIQALKDAYLWDFVESLEDGIYTRIGENGGLLSGGQKQKLSIARALVKRASLVLLDEATSALDTQSEFEVQKALESLLAGRAAVIVTHRVSSLMNVDYVYCFSKGTVIEEGTIDTLLQQKGYFYKMKLQQE